MVKQKVMNQLSIDFDPEITTSYSTCVEYVDDLERYMKETGDYEPAIYLAAKFIYKGSEASLRKQIAELQAKLNTVT